MADNGTGHEGEDAGGEAPTDVVDRVEGTTAEADLRPTEESDPTIDSIGVPELHLDASDGDAPEGTTAEADSAVLEVVEPVSDDGPAADGDAREAADREAGQAESAVLEVVEPVSGDGSTSDGDAPEVADAAVEAEVDGTVPESAEVTEVEDPVGATLVRIERRLDEVARLGERHAEHVGSLHAENQRLRSGELATVVGPLLRDAIRVHDDILRLESSCAPEAALDLGLVRDLLIGMLDRWGLRPFQPEVGDAFDTTEHNGIARVDTSDPLGGTVAAVRRCGFRAEDGRIWRPADIEVYRQVDRDADEPAPEQE